MTTIRIYGQHLREPETIIDATITEITLDETVHLSSVDDDRTWTMNLSTLQGYLVEHSAAKHEDISHPTHPIWDRLNGAKSDLDSEPFASTDRDFNEKLEDIFTEIMSVMVEEPTSL